jgi:hypothetical protein
MVLSSRRYGAVERRKADPCECKTAANFAIERILELVEYFGSAREMVEYSPIPLTVRGLLRR